MLNQLRNASRTWIAGVFIALLVASFAIWGVSDIFTGGVRDAVVVVGKDRISVRQVRAEFDRQLNQLSQQAGTVFDRETAVALGLDQQVVQTMALRSAFAQRAEALGLTASQEAVFEELRQIDAFIDPFTGRFDASTYRSLLAQNGLLPDEFESDMANSIIDTQISGVLSAGLRPPDALVNVRMMFMNETRGLSIVAVPPEAAGEPDEPTQEELEAFYVEREARYTTPPRRAFSLATIAVDDFLLDAPVSEEELREAYELELPRLSTPDTRDLVELTAPDEETAAEAARRLRAGEEPDAVAADLGLAEPVSYDDALAVDLLSSAVREPAFAVPEGEVTDPIDGGISWFVYRVDEVNEGEQPSFEEARTELRAELASGYAADMLYDAVDAFEAARSSGVALESAAVAARVPVFSYGLTDSGGADADGVRPDLFAQYPEILQEVFALAATGVTTDLIELGEDGYFVVRLDEIAPAAVRPLAEIEDQVRAEYAATAFNRALDDIARAAHDALESGAAPSEAAAAASEDARGETSALRRGQQTATLSPQALGLVFSAEVGDVVTAPSPNGGRVVVRVDSVSLDPTEENPDADPEIMRARLSQEITPDLAQMYNMSLQEAYPSRVDPRLLAQATGLEPIQ